MVSPYSTKHGKTKTLKINSQNPESMDKTKITCVSGEMHIP